MSRPTPMNRAELLYVQISVVLVTLTGAVFAFMKYAMTSDDPYSVVNHPLQPTMLSAHVFLAPFLVFAFGWLFSDHIRPKLNSPAPRRRSGIWSMAMIVPMVLSAYLLQISTGEGVRRAMAIAHWVTSALFVAGYVAHLVASRTGAENNDSPC